MTGKEEGDYDQAQLRSLGFSFLIPIILVPIVSKYYQSETSTVDVPSPMIVDHRPRIAFIGDSITTDGWGGYAKAVLEDEARAYVCPDNGKRSADAVELLDHLQQRRAWRNLHLVTLGIGLHDAMRKVPVAEFARNYERLIRLARQSGARRIVLLTITPPNPRGELAGRCNVRPYNAAIGRLASKHDLPLIDFGKYCSSWDSHITYGDAVHFDSRSKELQGKWLSERIRPLIYLPEEERPEPLLSARVRP